MLLAAILISLIVSHFAHGETMGHSYAIDVDLDPPIGVPAIQATATPEQPGVGIPKSEPPPLRGQKSEMSPSFRKGCGGYPVCNPFYAEFKACEPTCEPIGYHSHRHDPGSCHNSGRAIDVFGMKCADTGNRYMAINNGRYQDMVRCVKRRGKLKVLWHNGRHRTAGHHDHAHFSVTCNGGRRW